MATQITGSPNIAVLDIKIIADLCEGKFFIDASPSIYIGSGALLVLGINIRVTNPLGVVIKDFTTSGYEIEGGSPPMQEVVEVSIPTEAGNYQYGTYSILATIYDEDGTEYSVTKTLTLSVPNTKNKTKKYGIATATIKGLCKDGKVVVQVNTPENYRGKMVESVEQEFTLTYPGGSNLDDLVTSLSAFSVPLFEGDYKIVGDICALYNLGENVYAKISYKLNYTKEIHCILNYECIGIQLSGYFDKLNSDCTDAKKKETNEIILKIIGLQKTIEYLSDYNQDASDYIDQLDELLGCSCTCDDMTGVPIVNNTPAKDFLIEGCNVTKETVGLTDHYTIENYEYAVSGNDNNVLTLGTPTIEGCVVTIPLNFDSSLLIQSIQDNISARNGIVPTIVGDVKYFELGGDVIKDTEITVKNPYALTLLTDSVNNYIKLLQKEVNLVTSLDAHNVSFLRSTGEQIYIINYDIADELNAKAINSGFYSRSVIKSTLNSPTPTDAGTVLIGINFPETSDQSLYPVPAVDANQTAYIEISQDAANSNDAVITYYSKTHNLLGKFNVTSDTVIMGNMNIGGAVNALFKLIVTGNFKFTGKAVMPIQTLTGTTPTWNLDNGEEATWTLSGNSTLAISNATGVCYGALTIINTSGTSTLTLPAGSIVGNFGAGSIDVTGAAGLKHVLCFRYDGTNFFWKKDKNYT
jgi:hypothetical protein